VQLSMPVLVALADTVFLSEPLTARLLTASATMLGMRHWLTAEREHSHRCYDATSIGSLYVCSTPGTKGIKLSPNDRRSLQ
jgi:hypothetical protein